LFVLRDGTTAGSHFLSSLQAGLRERPGTGPQILMTGI
jgi:hypothetical protein